VRESQIEKSVEQWAKNRGWFVRKLAWLGRSGAPDRIFIRAGRVVFIEFKAPGKAVIPGSSQDREHARMREAGAEVHVASSIEQAQEILGADES
jgi:hypothetical protein